MMSLGIWFLIFGAVFVLSEIFSFTFYFLAIGIAFFIGSAFLLNGYSTNFSLYATGISMIAGIVVAHMVRKKLNNPESDKVSQDDVGNDVIIESITGCEARVGYRGTHWNAHFDDGEDGDAKPGDKLYIVRREGNLLFISSQKPDKS